MKTATTTRMCTTASMQMLNVTFAIATGHRADVVSSVQGRLSSEPFFRLPLPEPTSGTAYGLRGRHASYQDRQPWPQSQGLSRLKRTLTAAA